MKKNFLWIFFLGIAMTFSSCDQNNVEPSTSESDLAEFALLAVSSSSNAVSGSSSTSTQISAAFSGKCNLTEVSTNTLSATITSYITSNYAGATIERAGKTNTGAYIVYLKNADGSTAALAFAANGTFVGTSSVQGTTVAIADLPAPISAYVAANYAGATIIKAMLDAEGNYLLALKKADGTYGGVAFNSEGTFKQEVSMKGKFGCGSKNTSTTTAAN